jgi:hypothetical protein
MISIPKCYQKNTDGKAALKFGISEEEKGKKGIPGLPRAGG